MTKLLWVDVETTGLDPDKDIVLSVGMRLTTDGPEIETLGEFEVDLPISLYWEPVKNMSDYVRSMHAKSGLLHRCVVPSAAWEERSRKIADLVNLDQIRPLAPLGVPMNERPRLAGSNAASFDKQFLRALMPEFIDRIHYRTVDVSTLYETVKLSRPDLLEGAPGKRDLHTPLADIDDSIALFRFLRQRLGLLPQAA